MPETAAAEVPSYLVMIPARLASTRLPNKVLLEAGGKPLLAHTLEAARGSHAERVVVAAESADIAQAMTPYDAEVVITGPADTGTDRLAKATSQLDLPDDTIVVNLQADEPTMPPAVLDQLASALVSNSGAAMATACCPISDAQELFNPNAVKVVLNARNSALYFSRAPLPYERGSFDHTPAGETRFAHYRHLGLYAYRAGFLKQYSQLAPCEAERAESLEQLRALHYGFEISVIKLAGATPPGVDTQQDWELFCQQFNLL